MLDWFHSNTIPLIADTKVPLSPQTMTLSVSYVLYFCLRSNIAYWSSQYAIVAQLLLLSTVRPKAVGFFYILKFCLFYC